MTQSSLSNDAAFDRAMSEINCSEKIEDDIRRVVHVGIHETDLILETVAMIHTARREQEIEPILP